jgi:NifB/MoaA-like Fe-S oxidoreductase
MYLHAGRELPTHDYYDSWDLTENGVGSISGFLSAFHANLSKVPRLDGRRIRILTGESMAPFIRRLGPSLEEATGAEIQVHSVINEFFGESVTVAGLLAGQDLLTAAGQGREDELILIPREALNADDLFLDSLSLADFKKALAPAKVLAGLEITETLGDL